LGNINSGLGQGVKDKEGIKDPKSFEKTTIPSFHYSMIKAETQASDNTKYFHQLIKIPRRFNYGTLRLWFL
jgi:hypothetical protein